MTPKARSASTDAGSVPALSPLAAFALAHADGTRTVADLADLAAATGAEGGTRDAIFRALDELADLGLLEARVTPPAGGPRVCRVPTVESAPALGVSPGMPLSASDDDTARKNQEEREKRQGEQSDKKVGKDKGDKDKSARGGEQSDKRSGEQSDKRA
ncbi:hypothetical protein [Polyangium fumosum]|uniref:Uncharacterized protein n=1 Tax=Polyangium fumosum TaxID=889272 RepID=A0A4V5PRQ2_9BACT|nr:hypothetical protein [Polyangium fumosum]TKD02790.1 hypothetical protein E8A74_28260 [Polyangium fumosum]